MSEATQKAIDEREAARKEPEKNDAKVTKEPAVTKAEEKKADHVGGSEPA